MFSRTERLTSGTHHRESQTAQSGKLEQVRDREKKEHQRSWHLGPMLVKAQICVDFTAGSEKSSPITGRMTMGHVSAQSVAVEGLENEKKVLGSATEAQKNMPDGHLRPRPRTKFVPQGDLFCSEVLQSRIIYHARLYIMDNIHQYV